MSTTEIEYLTSPFVRRAAIAGLWAAMSTGAVGCSRFVWHEDPFTPDPAPASEVVAFGQDTTYVLRGSGYYLLAPERSALWNREVIDDVAWRYRALFGEAPPIIAVRFDSSGTASDTASTWRGMPLANVAVRRRNPLLQGKEKASKAREREAEDSVRARMLVGPMLAATAAQAWVDARIAAARTPDGQPGGPTRLAPRGPALPAWVEAGATRILASSGSGARATAELRADKKRIVPLASLFAVAWTGKPNAIQIASGGNPRFDLDGEDESDREIGVRQEQRRKELMAGVSPQFIAQAASVLTFLRERDSTFVSRLVDDLARGGSMETALGASGRLPHDVVALDAEWRKWLDRSAKRK